MPVFRTLLHKHSLGVADVPTPPDLRMCRAYLHTHSLLFADVQVIIPRRCSHILCRLPYASIDLRRCSRPLVYVRRSPPKFGFYFLFGVRLCGVATQNAGRNLIHSPPESDSSCPRMLSIVDTRSQIRVDCEWDFG